MANLYVGINRGQYPRQIVFKSSTNSTDMELRIDLSKNLNDADRAELIRAIEEAVANPPAVGVNGFPGWGDSNT